MRCHERQANKYDCGGAEHSRSAVPTADRAVRLHARMDGRMASGLDIDSGRSQRMGHAEDGSDEAGMPRLRSWVRWAPDGLRVSAQRLPDEGVMSADATKTTRNPGFDGMDARRRGEPVEACPYEPGSQRTAWEIGRASCRERVSSPV